MASHPSAVRAYRASRLAVDSLPTGLEGSVRDALHHLHDLPYLQRHPLALRLTWDGSGRLAGKALQKMLLDAVEALRPGREVSSQSHAWRSHQILHLRYVEGLDVAAVHPRLSISRREFYRDHSQAIQALALLLEERLGLERLEGREDEKALAGKERAAREYSRRSAHRPSLAVLPRARGNPSNLPLSLTSFVGRERDMAEVMGLLAKTRLLTLSGPGGCGKSRLAVEVASEVLEGYSDGVRLVELADLADPALVPQAVAVAVGVRELPGESILETLADRLGDRHGLLVLDNCEHLVGACAHLVESLLKTCRGLSILATSREALRTAGEVVWSVPPLEAPDPAHLPEVGEELVSELLRYSAVRLFVERAAAARPGFTPTEQNALAVAEVCRRLDGIPLAIELAAARVRLLTVEEMAQRLGDRLSLLTSGQRTALPRHKTLRALTDWSYELLSERERLLFNRLAVFAGAFGLSAAEAICGDPAGNCQLSASTTDASEPSGEAMAETSGAGADSGSGAPGNSPRASDTISLAQDQVLETLGHLVDKSLVQVETRGELVRYRLLETIRQYAWERLAATGEVNRLRDRHRDWYLELTDVASEELWGPDQAFWLDRLEVEHANFRAALAWCLEADAEKGVRLAGNLVRFWLDRGHFSEARRWLDATLARTSEPTKARARALFSLGYVASRLGDPASASALFEESLAVFRETDDRSGLAFTLMHTGTLAAAQGDHARARELLEESVALFQGIGDTWRLGSALCQLAILTHSENDYSRAKPLYEESLTLIREGGNQRSIDYALSNLAALVQAEGDLKRARSLLEESLAIAREVGHSLGIIGATIRLGNLARAEGDLGRARTLLEESLYRGREIGDVSAVAEPLALLGDLARAEGDYTRARAHFGEGLALCRSSVRSLVAAFLGLLGVLAIEQEDNARGVRLIRAAAVVDRFFGLQYLFDICGECEAALVAAREAMGEEAFERAWTDGQTMTLDRAIEYAFQRLDTSTFPETSPPLSPDA